MDNEVARRCSSNNAENIGGKRKGSDDNDQERRIKKRGTKEVIQLLRCQFKVLQILINYLCYTMQSNGIRNITSFLEYGKKLVNNKEFFRAIVWFKRTIAILEDKEEYPSESNKVKLLIELIRALEKVKKNKFYRPISLNLISSFIYSRKISQKHLKIAMKR